MMGEVQHLRLRPPQLGDLLKGRKPAAIRRLVRHREDPAAADLQRRGRALVALDQHRTPFADPPDILRRHRTGEDDLPGHFIIGKSQHEFAPGQIEQFAESVVDDDETSCPVEHEQPLRHVVQRQIEAFLLHSNSSNSPAAPMKARDSWLREARISGIVSLATTRLG